MPAKRKKADKPANQPEHTPAPQSAAAAAATEGDHRRPQSSDLPGMVGDGVAQPDVPALDEAVRDYVTFRDARIEKGLKEKTNKKLVLALMEKHNLSSYKVDDLVVVRKPKDETESIKVMAAADYTGGDLGTGSPKEEDGDEE